MISLPLPTTAALVPFEPAALIPAPPPRQASSDADVIRLWLHGRGVHTRRAYRHDVERFVAFVARPLQGITLGDLQDFMDSLNALAASSQGRTVASVKSLLTFGCKIGYLRFNVGAAVQPAKVKNALAERILTEDAVHKMLAFEPDARNAAVLRLLYGSGLRVSELCGLRWRDAQARGDAGQVTTQGKGGVTRSVLLSVPTWAVIEGLRGESGPDAAVFVSQKGTPLSTSQVLRIVRAAAGRAGIELPVSPHWLRHAHASHALDRGAPIHLVQATLGHASIATTGRYLHARPNDSSGRYLAV